MNFQPPSKSLTSRDYLFIALVVVLFFIISAGLTYANLSLPNGGGDFLRHWAGGRAFIFEQTEPYTLYVPEVVQKLVYGGSGLPDGEPPFILDTPFHLLLLYFPLSLLPDPVIARAIYTLILEWALFGLVVLSLRLTEWTVPRWFSVLFFLFSVLNFYTFQAILAASPILILGLLYAGVLFALRHEQDELAGALMALSLYYWEAGLPFLILMLWRSYKERRMRVFAGFGMLSVVLLFISFLVYPGWILPYLRAGMNNLNAVFGFSIITALQNLLPSYGKYLAWGVIVLLVFALGYEWNASQYGDERRLYWTACLTLAATPLLGFRTEFWNLSVLIIPIAFMFAVIYDRWNQIGAWLILLFLAVFFALPWTIYLFTPLSLAAISGEVLYLFLPVLTVLGLYWIRWWAIRPPRVWADALTQR